MDSCKEAGRVGETHHCTDAFYQDWFKKDAKYLGGFERDEAIRDIETYIATKIWENKIRNQQIFETTLTPIAYYAYIRKKMKTDIYESGTKILKTLLPDVAETLEISPDKAESLLAKLAPVIAQAYSLGLETIDRMAIENFSSIRQAPAFSVPAPLPEIGAEQAI